MTVSGELALFCLLRPNCTSSRSREKCGSWESSPNMTCKKMGRNEEDEGGGMEMEG